MSLFEFSKYRDEETRLEAAWGWDWAIPYPERCGWDSALWLEIDVAVLGDQFIDVDALETMCQAHCVNTFSIYLLDIDIEAACRGDVPPSAIKSAYVVGRDVDWQTVYRRDPLAS